jgi:transcriptional regulator GlxA family with amidase domain
MDDPAKGPARITHSGSRTDLEHELASAVNPDEPLEIVAHVARRTFTTLLPAPAGPPSHATVWTVKYIANHFAEDIRLDDLARGVQLSKYHFLRKFRQEAGLTPGAYLKRYRIVRAMDHLIGTRHTIKQIGQMVGYRDPAAFSRAFTQIAGTQPYLYRVTRRAKVAEEPATYG